jgi:hypothetical protein
MWKGNMRSSHLSLSWAHADLDEAAAQPVDTLRCVPLQVHEGTRRKVARRASVEQFLPESR